VESPKAEATSEVLYGAVRAPRTLHLNRQNWIARLPDVIEMTGLARSTILKLVKSGQFPQPLQLSPRTVGWRVAAVEKWLADRPTAGTATSQEAQTMSALKA
jgi:predicted DNA-binding transcriptional regulator AlpA